MSYIQNLRTKIGHSKFIHPAARIIIENEKGEILFIERADNGKLGIPAGALEEGETIEECIRREVLEETGLELLEVELIGISSDPKTESVTYPNGDEIQYFTVEFFSNKWKGELKPQSKAEVKSALFMSIDKIKSLPLNETKTFHTLRSYRRSGTVQLG